MGQDKHRQTGAIGMETLNSLSALPAAIVEPIGFVGFPSLATAVPFRRNFFPATSTQNRYQGRASRRIYCIFF